jgi:hypothetical protein
MLAASPAAAGTGNGIPFNVVVESSGVAIFNLPGTHAGNPTCSTSGRWAFVANTPAGQGMLATLLTAYGSGKTIFVNGTGDCSAWPDSEALTYIGAN